MIWEGFHNKVISMIFLVTFYSNTEPFVVHLNLTSPVRKALNWSGLYPSSRAPYTRRIYNKKHWSCSGDLLVYSSVWRFSVIHVKGHITKQQVKPLSCHKLLYTYHIQQKGIKTLNRNFPLCLYKMQRYICEHFPTGAYWKLCESHAMASHQYLNSIKHLWEILEQCVNHNTHRTHCNWHHAGGQQK